jgi:hypothetical protein
MKKTVCVQRNIEARSCDNCCSGKVMSITQHVCICSLRYPAYNAHEPYRHLWPASFYNIFPHNLRNGKIFERENKVTEYKMCAASFSTNFARNIFHSKKN